MEATTSAICIDLNRFEHTEYESGPSPMTLRTQVHEFGLFLYKSLTHPNINEVVYNLLFSCKDKFSRQIKCLNNYLINLIAILNS
jgi:hypothetical protein